jgi:uncharacterized SAM-binding protein YcdF (DUF218 family)
VVIRRRGKRLVIALALLALIVVTSPAACYVITTPLTVRDQVDRADAIVVLNGNTEERVRYGTQLYLEGRADVIIMSGGNLVNNAPESRLMKDMAVSLGVPPTAILTEEKSNTTITNARYSAEVIRQHGFRSILLVTSPYHSRRATRMFRDTLGPEVQVYSQPVPNSTVSLEHWWLYPQMRQTVASESIQLFTWLILRW